MKNEQIIKETTYNVSALPRRIFWGLYRLSNQGARKTKTAAFSVAGRMNAKNYSKTIVLTTAMGPGVQQYAPAGAIAPTLRRT
jgi:hypothetical protein